MPNQRIKGQEVEVLLIAKNNPLVTISDVRDFEVAPMFDILQEGYLGEGTDRFDEVFRGARFRMTLHIENGDILDFMRQVINRAKRRDPTAQINVKATLNFPSGDRRRVAINNCFFGEMPLNFGGRAEYGAVTLDGKCGDINFLT